MPTSSTTSGLDVAARGIDLTTALINYSNTSPKNNILLEIGQWLGRERLGQYELEDFMKKARGLVFPNSAGHAFFADVIKGGEQMLLPHLFLRQSGSLGRLMAGDPWLQWVVSTASCLFQFHRDETRVSDSICAILMRANNPVEGGAKHESELAHHPLRVQLKAVVDKIVSSIWFNVVNSGHHTISLPKELMDVCIRGHYLQSSQFGAIVHVLQNSHPRLIVRAPHLMRNLVLWLLLHFSGTLQITVSGSIIFKHVQGELSRIIEIRVASFCPEGECDPEIDPFIEVLEDIADTYKELFSCGYGDELLGPSPGVRQSLYNVMRPFEMDSLIRGRTVELSINGTAQHIMRWLLSLAIRVPGKSKPFRFSVRTTNKPEKNEAGLKICNILKRHPSMLNKNWGSDRQPRMVFAEAGGNRSEIEPELKRKIPAKTRLLSYLPVLQDLLNEVGPLCECIDCGSEPGDLRKGTSGYGKYKAFSVGCYKDVAYREVLVLLAHGIADGFGCNDVSAVIDPEPSVDGMVVLLTQLCSNKEMVWDTWFNVAATVFLGCPFESPHTRHGQAIAALQYGNLAVVAPWLDLSTTLTIEGSFGLIEGKGRLGVHQHNGTDHQRYHSFEDNYAVIGTEVTENNSSYVERHPKPSLPPGVPLSIIEDNCTVTSDYLLVGAGSNYYRILLRIQTQNHSRFVDPHDTVGMLARGIQFDKCDHGPGDRAVPDKLDAKIMLYSFDEVLGRWAYASDRNELERYRPEVSRSSIMEGILHVSHFMGSPLKQNVALALSVDEVAVVDDGSSCFSCLVQKARSAPRPGGSTHRHEPYIILFSTGSESQALVTTSRGR
ncbi:MAG: hypothetical protein Q9187_005489 [Circinaria calcarea]